MKPNRDSDELAKRPPAAETATTTNLASNAPKPKPDDSRWLPLLNEVEDTPGRHDVYHCPRAADRKNKS